MQKSFSFYKEIQEKINYLKEIILWSDKDSIILSYIINNFNIGDKLDFIELKSVSYSKSINFTPYILEKINKIRIFYNKTEAQIFYALLCDYIGSEKQNNVQKTLKNKELTKEILLEHISDLYKEVIQNI